MRNSTPSAPGTRTRLNALPRSWPNPRAEKGAAMARQIHLPPRTRLIDPSGRAQVHPIGLQRHAPSDLYHWLLTIPWIPLFLVILGFFFVLNALFALAYLA